MEQHLRGEYFVTASGGRLYRFINDIQQAGICCRGQHCRNDGYCFRVYARSRGRVEAIGEKHGVALSFTPRPTLAQLLFRYRFRLGIPIGLLLAGGLLFYGSNIVLHIEVIGNEAAPTAEILSVLEEQHVVRGKWIPSIDFTACEHALRAQVDELAWVGIRHTGNRLVVEVMERTPEPEMLEERVPCNIISAQDAQITGFTIGCGQIMRLVGDGVQKGELLVSGIVTDETGHLSIRHAMGSVVGIYEQTETFQCPFVQEIREETGTVTRRRYLDLFSWHIPLEKAPELPEDYRKTTSYSWFSLLGKELPVGIYCESFYPYQTHLTALSPEEAAADLQEQMQRYEDNFLTQTEILSREKTVTETDTGLEWTVCYTLQGEIGVQQEVFVRDLDYRAKETAEEETEASE